MSITKPSPMKSPSTTEAWNWLLGLQHNWAIEQTEWRFTIRIWVYSAREFTYKKYTGPDLDELVEEAHEELHLKGVRDHIRRSES